MLIKVAIVVVLLVIIASLFSALYFLVKDKGNSGRTVKALTIRISISILLFIALVIAAKSGVIGHSL